MLVGDDDLRAAEDQVMMTVLPVLIPDVGNLEFDRNRLAGGEGFFLRGKSRLQILRDLARFPNFSLPVEPIEQLVHGFCGVAIEYPANSINPNEHSDIPTKCLLIMLVTVSDTEQVLRSALWVVLMIGDLCVLKELGSLEVLDDLGRLLLADLLNEGSRKVLLCAKQWHAQNQIVKRLVRLSVVSQY